METRMTVLIVDDDRSVRAVVKTLLEDEFEVAEAPNGVVALVRAWDVRPDVIVLDLDMPAMGGGEAAPYLRILSPKSAIVVFSGDIDCKPMWADAFAEKGDTHSLVEAVREQAARAREDSLWLQLQSFRQDVPQAG